MTTQEIAHPPVAGRSEWLLARKSLLEHEKEATRHKDRVSAERRRLPMVRLDKKYVFEGPDGLVTIAQLFEGRAQLIVYHFMFDPEWDKGCGGCTWFVDSLGDISGLNRSNTTFALISRAPIAKLEEYKAKKGWKQKWVSSFDSDFNYDFHATMDSAKAPVEYNYLTKAEIEARGLTYITEGEQHGLSVFFRLDDEVFHTYSSYARGVEGLTDANSLLDVTPYGRQEDWEDSPAGWPQNPTYG